MVRQYAAFPAWIALGISVALSGCVSDDASEDLTFTGDAWGCMDFLVRRESSGEGLWVLEVEHYEANHQRDTAYEVQLSDWDGTVRLIRYSGSGGAWKSNCNDVVVADDPVRKLGAWQAVSGRLSITVSGFRTTATTLKRSTSGREDVWKDYDLNLELHDAVFEDGSKVRRARMDSVHVGWLPG